MLNKSYTKDQRVNISVNVLIGTKLASPLASKDPGHVSNCPPTTDHLLRELSAETIPQVQQKL